MSNQHFSRRGFISTVALSGATLTTMGNPLTSPPGSLRSPVSEPVDPNRAIKVASFEKLTAEEQQRIKAVSPNIQLQFVNDDSSPAIADAEIVFGWMRPEAIAKASKLKWLQTWAAGVAHMPANVVSHPVTITNMQRIFAPVIAETAIGLLLSLTRGIARFAVPNFMKKAWVETPPSNLVLDDLYQKTIGIVGMGGIGSETARRLHYGFSMKVIGTDAKPMPRPDFVDTLRDPSWLMEMVPQCDVLMSAAPLTAATKEMFNEKVFSALRPGAYFINVSRGGLVDQAALINALKSGKIRGAGLDVATPEPLPADSPLWDCPNLVITAHNSGHAEIRKKRLTDLVVENVRRYTLGLPLMNVVDKQKGY